MPDAKDDAVKDELSDLHAGTDWGEDWESAFQAEDDFFVADDTDVTDFPLDDTQAPAATPPPAASQQANDLAKPTDETVITDVSEDVGEEAKSASLAKFSQLKARIVGLFTALYARFLAAKLTTKILAIAVLASIIVLIGSLLLLLPSSEVAQKNNVAKLALPLTLPVQQQKIPEQLRTKWKYENFFIPVAAAKKDAPQAFVELSITLVLMLDKDETLPEDKKTFTRDLIYQFYTNRPLYELRRFTLARGEMSRKLKEWIRKQWPQGPLETIIFNRYQVS